MKLKRILGIFIILIILANIVSPLFSWELNTSHATSTLHKPTTWAGLVTLLPELKTDDTLDLSAISTVNAAGGSNSLETIIDIPASVKKLTITSSYSSKKFTNLRIATNGDIDLRIKGLYMTCYGITTQTDTNEYPEYILYSAIDIKDYTKASITFEENNYITTASIGCAIRIPYNAVVDLKADTRKNGSDYTYTTTLKAGRVGIQGMSIGAPAIGNYGKARSLINKSHYFDHSMGSVNIFNGKFDLETYSYAPLVGSTYGGYKSINIYGGMFVSKYSSRTGTSVLGSSYYAVSHNTNIYPTALTETVGSIYIYDGEFDIVSRKCVSVCWFTRKKYNAKCIHFW